MKSVAISYKESVKLTRDQIVDLYGEEDMLFVDGCDDCILGVVERFGQPAIICYDKCKIIEKYMNDGMDLDEAEEFFQYNTIGSWVGEHTPCFIIQCRNKE
ncbi:MAG: hypothetical protein WC119_02775 [Synergistaceae bacterium]